jgi:prepilin-type processing-associated H-X9-DG protein
VACTQNTPTVALSVAGGALSANVNLSANAGNILGAVADGLYAASLLEIGDVMWSARTTKTNFLFCDGSAVSRSTYSLLFTQIGTAFGAGDGSTTFNIPDLQGRHPVGKGTNADVSALGANEGVGTVASRRPKHRTSDNLTVSSSLGVSDPGHTHRPLFTPGGGAVTALGQGAGSSASYGGPQNNASQNFIETSTTGITLSGSQASRSGSIGTNLGTDPLDTSPYLVLNPFVRAL